VSHCPVDNDLHLPDERQSPIKSEEHDSGEGGVTHEGRLVWRLWIAMLDLKAREDQMTTPEQVVHQKSLILAESDALLGRHDKASVDVDPDH